MGFGILKINEKSIEILEIKELFISKILDDKFKFKKIFNIILDIIDTYSPSEVAIEATFIGKNAQSSIKIGRAQGIAIAAALYKKKKITEYSPKKIKMSITGNGNSTKNQVSNMLKKILNIGKFPCSHFDASDALAVAVCHYKFLENKY